METILKNDKGISLVVVILIMVLLLSITGAGLIFSGTGLRTTGAFRAGTQAFYAAETGVSAAINQLPSTTPVDSGPPVGGVAYRSGRRGDAGPQPISQPGPSISRSGYASDSGTTTYNADTGWRFDPYQINITGTGPIGAAREIEVQAEYGPKS